jgi:hypothetical protein
MRAAVTISIAMCVTACMDGDNHIASTFARDTFCPSDRVHVAVVPALAVEPFDAHPRPSEPWQEPELPLAVARAPARMRLWQAQRDAAYAEWQAGREQTQAQDSERITAARRAPVYEVTGCGGNRLYRCDSASWQGCSQVTEAISVSDRLTCTNGSTPRVVDGKIACVPGEAITNVYWCTNACGDGTACQHGCTDDSCRLSCATSTVHCIHDCAAKSHAQCEAAGLARLGLCESLAQLDRSTGESDEHTSRAAAEIHDQADDRAMFDTIEATSHACADPCRRATDSRALTTCMLRCATRAVEQCERDAKRPDVWCKGLHIQYDSLHDAQDLLERQARDAPKGT